jgi:hypothetical protein
MLSASSFDLAEMSQKPAIRFLGLGERAVPDAELACRRLVTRLPSLEGWRPSPASSTPALDQRLVEPAHRLEGTLGARHDAGFAFGVSP